MDQLLPVAIGGAFGAMARFLVSSGVYQWLGKDFPYGTLVVNILGSFLLGLLTESLLLNRVAFAQDYRSAILIGFIGAFTTFSTFSLDTVYLLEQGQLPKAMINVVGSIGTCLVAIWLGLICSRILFAYDGGVINLLNLKIPFALIAVNCMVAFLLGFVITLLLDKVALQADYAITIRVIVIGLFLTFSVLYLLLFHCDQCFFIKDYQNSMLSVIVINLLACSLTAWLSQVVARQF